MGEQDLVDLDESRLRGEPLAEDRAARIEEPPVLDAVNLPQQPFLRGGVPEIVGHHHDLVVPQQDLQPAAVPGGVSLEAVKEPQGPSHVGAPIHEIAEQHDESIAAAPQTILIDKAGVLEQLHQPVVFPVHIAHHVQTVDIGELELQGTIR